MNKKQLIKLGFKKEEFKFEDIYGDKQVNVVYVLKGRINDSIYFNDNEDVYKFYYKTKVGKGYNSVHLSIDKLSELILVLQVFQFKFNF